VQRLLDRVQELTDAERNALDATITFTHGTGDQRGLWTARDHAWHRLHEALAPHGLTAAFHTLWQDLHIGPHSHRWVGFLTSDAACATMLAHALDQGSFTTVAYDTLRGPWCAVIDHCARSRLFLQMVPSCYPAETLWPIVDAVLTPRAQ
jgi:hypothetical protein